MKKYVYKCLDERKYIHTIFNLTEQPQLYSNDNVDADADVGFVLVVDDYNTHFFLLIIKWPSIYFLTLKC